MPKEDNSKLVAILSYITIIGWIVALILNNSNKSSLGSFHIRQSLLIMIVGLVGLIPIIGWIVSLALFVFWIMGLIYAINGQEKEIPIIGKYAQDWFKGL
jgi:uncharacterized membrane protein